MIIIIPFNFTPSFIKAIKLVIKINLFFLLTKHILTHVMKESPKIVLNVPKKIYSTIK